MRFKSGNLEGRTLRSGGASPSRGIVMLIGTVVIFLAGLSRSPAAETKDGFRVLTERVPMQEQDYVYGYAIVIGKQKFSFLPPGDWVQESSAKDKSMTFTRRDLKAVLTLRISQTNIDSKIWLQSIHQQFPDAQVTAEFACCTAGLIGKAFELERITARNLKLVSRVAYVPFSGGIIVFQMTTTPEIFKACHPLFGRVLTSFKVEELPVEKALSPKAER